MTPPRFWLEPVGARQREAAEAADRQAWAWIGGAFAVAPGCDDQCPHWHSFEQRQPYGNTWATEHLCECTLGNRATDRPQQCPALVAHLADQEQPDPADNEDQSHHTAGRGGDL